jgi:hypothetical protein
LASVSETKAAHLRVSEPPQKPNWSAVPEL